MISSSLKSVCTFFCRLNKTCIMIETSPKGSWWFPTNRPHYCGDVLWCGVVCCDMVWFYQGPHSVLLPHRPKIDWLKQEEAGSHSQGLTHTHSQILLWSRVLCFTMRKNGWWRVSHLTPLLSPFSLSTQVTWMPSFSFSSEGKHWTKSRELFMWIVYLVESG